MARVKISIIMVKQVKIKQMESTKTASNAQRMKIIAWFESPKD